MDSYVASMISESEIDLNKFNEEKGVGKAASLTDLFKNENADKNSEEKQETKLQKRCRILLSVNIVLVIIIIAMCIFYSAKADLLIYLHMNPC